ncbi:hypothetical protein [Haloglomus halophilum]|uniref:hypothetical protein n=1 Tax=Haloglomus halophilum TaxID=2962672 RepID=UPI0020C9952C|nr:hypothetical protein [Haloglomus halophilum]
MDHDWDNLIIIDACRYDVFTEVAGGQFEVEKRISRGSHTTEFLERNFSNRMFRDTVYVSATPQLVSTSLHEQFYDFLPLWETHWDDELNTVPPQAAVEASLEAEQEYPDKRLICHLLQPHYPFIGETGRQLNHRTVSGGGEIDTDHDKMSIWRLLEIGEVDKETVYKAYVENLELTMPHVRHLVTSLNGKSVLTSDHGNSFGRFGIYGHPRGKFLRDLVLVPWVEFDSNQRKSISNGAPNDSEAELNEDITERLRNLGYK